MANEFRITQDTWERMPKEQRDWIMYETVLGMKDDINILKAKRWVNSGCALIGGAVGGFIFSLMKSVLR